MQLDLGFQGPEPAREEKKPVQPQERSPATPAPRPPQVFTVSELNRAVRDLLEGTIGEVWIRGEVSNHRCQSSGHHYFSLKDSTSQISCVLFAGTARRIRSLRLEDGREVQAFGRLSVYEARGQYQLVVEQLQEAGIGALQAKFEALKASLAAEGLFDTSRKKPMPKFPRIIGVVTSPTGAAIRDFLHVLHRRMPGIRVIIAPARVQGRGAAAEIADAIRTFQPSPTSRLPAVDAIVVTRGGGSVEDLWEFNEEVVARAIAASSIPVVSAVGHEIDFTIADFVADFRAPTPSAAAEILAADGIEMMRAVTLQSRRLVQTVANQVRFLRTALSAIERGGWMRDPARKIEQCNLRLDDYSTALAALMRDRIQRAHQSLTHATHVLKLHRPDTAIRQTRERLGRWNSTFSAAVRHQHEVTRQRVERTSDLLSALSPLATISRGYTITTDAAGNILRSSENLRSGMPLRTRFADGEVSSSVHGVTRTDPKP